MSVNIGYPQLAFNFSKNFSTRMREYSKAGNVADASVLTYRFSGISF